jgi:hypothetical protein
VLVDDTPDVEAEMHGSSAADLQGVRCGQGWAIECIRTESVSGETFLHYPLMKRPC